MQGTSIVGNLLTTSIAPIVLFVQFPAEHESSVPGRHQDPLGHLVRMQGPCGHIPRGAGQMTALASTKEDVNILNIYIYIFQAAEDRCCLSSCLVYQPSLCVWCFCGSKSWLSLGCHGKKH